MRVSTYQVLNRGDLMIVKIGNDFYDSDDLPIMLILDETDKDNISNMGKQTKYCRFPKDTKDVDIVNFMKVNMYQVLNREVK